MTHQSLKKRLIVCFALMFWCAVNNPCLANSTLALPFPESDYGLPDSSRIEQFSGYGSGGDYYDFPKKPAPGQGGFRDLQNSLWLVPVLRYLITVNGNSVQMEADPVVSLLPVVLQTAARWWFHEEQVFDLLGRRNETVVGDPFPIFTEVVDGGGNDKKSDGDSSPPPPHLHPQSSEKATSQSFKKTNWRQRQYRKRTSDDDGEEGFQPPRKRPQREASSSDKESIAQLLNQAIHDQNLDATKRLLASGASPIAVWNGEWPLRLAFQIKNLDIFEVLLKNVAANNLQNEMEVLDVFYQLVSESKVSSEVHAAVPYVNIFFDIGMGNLHIKNILKYYLLKKEWDEYPSLRWCALRYLKASGFDINELIYLIINRPELFSGKSLNFLIQNKLDVDKLLPQAINLFSKGTNRLIPLRYGSDIDRDSVLIYIIEVLITLKETTCTVGTLVLLSESIFDDYPNLRVIVLKNLQNNGINIQDMRYNDRSLVAHIAGSRRHSLSTLEWILTQSKEESAFDQCTLDEGVLPD